ncbi:rCG43200 [Rattus norvegicus]|uniref:RCG43200 n=1 Tax=Rattus norvegicus TaxID=10116 RepID=A6IWM3_RAT|nr:rCG43200 [Rattus norvegicus]
MRTMGPGAEPPLAENGTLAHVYLRSKCFGVRACLGNAGLRWPERKNLFPSSPLCSGLLDIKVEVGWKHVCLPVMTCMLPS